MRCATARGSGSATRSSASSGGATLAEAGRTIVVRPGATLVVRGRRARAAGDAVRRCGRAVRSGYALKRMDADEGPRRWVLRDLRATATCGCPTTTRQLFELLDGSALADRPDRRGEQRFGATGAARLARLLADLGERGFLAGVAGARRPREPPGRVLAAAGHAAREGLPRARRVLRRALPARRLGAVHAPGALARSPRCASRGSCVFGLLIGLRYGTPFVVANRIGSAGSCSCSAASWSSPCTRLAHG